MKYEILKSVGEGAYGTVYKCKNVETGTGAPGRTKDFLHVGETVAVKQFKDCEEDIVVKRTTLREVKILRMLRHENIVQLKEAFRRYGHAFLFFRTNALRKDRLYLVFEFVDMNLLEVLTRMYPNGFGSKLVRETMWQLVRALDFCHRHDVMHRDIKPENLLLSVKDFRVKLCDFGFARMAPISREDALTDYVATRWYRAPELLLGCPRYGPAVDMFALGCIMGEIIDGQPLLPGESELDQLCLIQLIIGPLTRSQLDEFNENPRFVGMMIPSRPLSDQEVCHLNVRFRTKESQAGLVFMHSLLEVQQSRRVSAVEALRDKYFANRKLPINSCSSKPAYTKSSRLLHEAHTFTESQRKPMRQATQSPLIGSDRRHVDRDKVSRTRFPSHNGEHLSRSSFTSPSLKRNSGELPFGSSYASLSLKRN